MRSCGGEQVTGNASRAPAQFFALWVLPAGPPYEFEFIVEAHSVGLFSPFLNSNNGVSSHPYCGTV